MVLLISYICGIVLISYRFFVIGLLKKKKIVVLRQAVLGGGNSIAAVKSAAKGTYIMI